MSETEPVGRQIRVFLLDDHEVVRVGVRDLLEAEPDITVAGRPAGTTASWHLPQGGRPAARAPVTAAGDLARRARQQRTHPGPPAIHTSFLAQGLLPVQTA